MLFIGDLRRHRLYLYTLFIWLRTILRRPVVTAQLTDLGDTRVEIGMPVEMVTRKIRQDGDERGMIACTPQGRVRVQVPDFIKVSN